MTLSKLAALSGATLLCTVACAQPSGPAADLGPMKYDASGTMPCSVGKPSFDQACGWRVLRKPGGGAEIWISNIVVTDRAAYRVLSFSQGEFSDRDGDPVQVSKDADMWSISVGQEHYQFADALITGGQSGRGFKLLGAREGQSMNVSMATDNGSNYFNIIPPGKADEAIFVGSMSGNQFEGTLPASGDYKIRVYLMRNAARRDETAQYRLEMIIN